jgi:GH15 family glucan-1,4-alpha-glucosidase
MPSRIEDYAIIGDTQTVGLVGRNGSLDWLCIPRFDSGACFAALLGTPDHGRWLIAPEAGVEAVRRRYLDGTLVLETEFRTAQGTVALIDFMPPREKQVDLFRIVEGRGGTVPMRIDVRFRFDYGSVAPWVRRLGPEIRAVAGPDAVRLRTDVEVSEEASALVSRFSVHDGERLAFDLTWHRSHEEAPPPIDPLKALDDTAGWWRQWSAVCRAEGEWKDTVVRSLITLKALTYAPTGGIVAAATTSLPERIGGVRNWDYRFCWIRDATFTLFALLEAGFVDEAAAWREWLLRAVAGDPSGLQIMYGPAGERRLSELELEWLPGYEGSVPVRVGNAATRQFQLDVYGEVIDSMHQARKSGIRADDSAWRLQRALMDFLEGAWRRPDEGIWEVRGPRRHFTHSKVMAWVALDRAVQAVERFGLEGPVDRWRALREEVHEQVCRDGFNSDIGAFVQYYGGRRLDASLLRIPLVGFLPASDPRVVATAEAIQRELMDDGFVYRYSTVEDVDGLPPGEGAFLACTCWMADTLLLMGRRSEAVTLFRRVVETANDVGLLSEQYDPAARRLVGNFPQAFSHVSVINTAINLTRARGPAIDRPEE